MLRMGIEVEKVSKGFDREERTLDEGIGFRQIIVVPDHFAGQCRQMDDERAGKYDGSAEPGGPEELVDPPNEIRSIWWLDRRFLRRLGHGFEVALLAIRSIGQRTGVLTHYLPPQVR